MSDTPLRGVCNDCGYAWWDEPDYWKRIDACTFAVRTGLQPTEMGMRRAVQMIPKSERPDTDALFWYDGEYEEGGRRWMKIKYAWGRPQEH